MSILNGSLSTVNPESPLMRMLSLPHELLQSILSSIANFEPWTYNSTLEYPDASIINDDLTLDTRAATPVDLTSSTVPVLGLSSESTWLMVVLSRHPYHLARHDKIGISSAITQAMRKMNAHTERQHWDTSDFRVAGSPIKTMMSTSLRDEVGDDVAVYKLPGWVSTKKFHATIQHEEAHTQENFDNSSCDTKRAGHISSPSTALVTYNPSPVLKLRHLDIIQLVHHQDLKIIVERMTVLFVAVLLMLARCRVFLVETLETLEKLQRNSPISSIEPFETKDFSLPNTSPQPDRLRSMSGSTVTEASPHKVPLSFSAISTIYSLGDQPRQVKWAEKRVAEEEENICFSPERPKLSDYKQVSSGRVATLMDKFEKFHL